MGKHNGWANYETWCVSLWAHNEEGTYRHFHGRAQELFTENTRQEATAKLAAELEDSHEELLSDSVPQGVFLDLATASLNRVYWEEIARSFFDE